MNDPLNDPRFPGRPSHPDFWRLSETVLRLDGDATEGGKDFPEVAEGLIDVESLMYIAEHRVAVFLAKMGFDDDNPIEPEVEMMMLTLFTTSVLTGIAFEKAGGHRA